MTPASPPPDPAAEIARLRRRQRIWTWVAVAGVILTAWAWLGRPASHAPSSRQIAQSSDMSEPSDPSDSHSPSSTEDFTDFSLSAVRSSFARSCPSVEVVSLSRPRSTKNYVGARSVPGTYFVFVYAPAPIDEKEGLLAWGVMGPGDDGVGTRTLLKWNCAIRVPRGSADESVPLRMSAIRADASAPRLEQQIPVLTAAQLTSQFDR